MSRERASDAERLHDLIRRYGLGGVEDQILNVVEPSLRLVGREVEGGAPPPGASRLGGDPDLPPGTPWPGADGPALSFLAQVNLGDVREHAPPNILPTEGLLSFFFDVEGFPWGPPVNYLAWCALYTPDTSSLVPTPKPVRAKRYLVRALEPRAELTIPFARTEAARGLQIDDGQFRNYCDLRGEYEASCEWGPPPGSDIHRMLGHPDPIQGDMTRIIEYELAGADLDEPVPALEAAARTWRLLLQVGSEEGVGMSWHNLGRLYFWIRAADLAAKRFDAVQISFQTS